MPSWTKRVATPVDVSGRSEKKGREEVPKPAQKRILWTMVVVD